MLVSAKPPWVSYSKLTGSPAMDNVTLFEVFFRSLSYRMVDVVKFPWETVYLVVYMTLYLVLSYVDSMDVDAQTEPYTPDYSLYHNLTTIRKELLTMSWKYPHYVHINWTYQSRNSRPQILIHFSDLMNQTEIAGENGERKLKLLLSFGEHSREFLPVESMLYLLHNLTKGLSAIKGSSSELFSRTVLSKIDLYIIAMSNPDGRAYLEDTKNYCWRGTGNGVDLNRNFGWEFGQKGSSSVKTDEEYRGTHAFSGKS